MRDFKYLFLVLVSGIILTSCVTINEDHIDNEISLNEFISSYDLWYVDYHRTEGNEDVPFLSKAFTISFFNGNMYANNNIVDIGRTGDGFGIQVGNYNTLHTILEMNHRLDGRYDFEVVQLSDNEIRIDCISHNVSYYLIGYQRDGFDYDKLFYDNIEYFLQEYMAWEQIKSEGGIPNIFDNEHYLQFTPENNVTFYSSKDPFGISINNIRWDFVGSYEIANINGYENLKRLTLDYGQGDTEAFELSVINDQTIELYHIRSETTYTFAGRGFIQYRKLDGKVKANKMVRNNGRKRTKIIRKIVERNITQ